MVNNGSGSQLDSIAITQKVCRRLPFKLREKVRKVASRLCKGNVLFQDLVDLVSKRLDQLDTCYAERKDSGSKRNAVGYESKPKLARADVFKSEKSSPAPDRPVCSVCEASTHAVYQCPRLTDMAVDERRFKMKSLGLCYNCLGHGHRVFDCKSSKRCGNCKGKHHTLLHITKKSSGEPEVERANPPTSTLAGAMAKVGAAGSCGAAIRLKVLPVKLKNCDTGVCVEAYGMLDSGCDLHLLSNKLSVDLGLEGSSDRTVMQTADGRR